MPRDVYGQNVRALLVETEDGTFTVRHPVLNENYHATQGAASEAWAKFIGPTRLAERLKSGPVRLLDIGLGLGVNCRTALECAGNKALHIDTLEIEPEALERGLLITPEDPMLLSLQKKGSYKGVHLLLGDMRKTLLSLKGPYDIIFHDPFSPLKNTEAWTVDVFTLLKERSTADTVLATYSESTIIRSALMEAGWQVGTSKAVPPHRGGTVATLRKESLSHPLDPQTFQTEPYRDPDLNWSGKRIRSEREAVVRSPRS